MPTRKKPDPAVPVKLGRPPLKAADRRSRRLQVKLTQAERAKLDVAAKSAGKRVTQLIRDRALAG